MLIKKVSLKQYLKKIKSKQRDNSQTSEIKHFV